MSVVNKSAEHAPLRFASPPALGSAYLRALWPRPRAGLERGGSLPSLRAEVLGVVLEREPVARFAKVCGLPLGETLPPTWPQVLAGGLQAELLISEAFPLKAVSLIHTGSELSVARPLRFGETVDLRVTIAGERWVDRGLEIDMETTARSGDETPWRGRMTLLLPQKAKGPKGPRKPKPEAPIGEAPEIERSTLWRFGADLGRRYAEVSGDWNPIHLHPLSAKLFGFPRPIAHGAFSLARALGELDRASEAGPWRARAQFRAPLLLPARVHFQSGPTLGGERFELRSADGRKTHLRGELLEGLHEPEPEAQA